MRRSAPSREDTDPGALLKAGICALLALSCASIPGRRYAVESISVSGNESIDDADIEEKIASRASPRFLGVFPGVVYDYEVFDRYVLERDLQRIESYYRTPGVLLDAGASRASFQHRST